MIKTRVCGCTVSLKFCDILPVVFILLLALASTGSNQARDSRRDSSLPASRHQRRALPNNLIRSHQQHSIEKTGNVKTRRDMSSFGAALNLDANQDQATGSSHSNTVSEVENNPDPDRDLTLTDADYQSDNFAPSESLTTFWSSVSSATADQQMLYEQTHNLTGAQQQQQQQLHQTTENNQLQNDMEKLVRSQLEATDWATVAPSEYLLSLSDHAKQVEQSILNYYNDMNQQQEDQYESYASGKLVGPQGDSTNPEKFDLNQLHSNHRYATEGKDNFSSGQQASTTSAPPADPMTTLSDGSNNIYSVMRKSSVVGAESLKREGNSNESYSSVMATSKNDYPRDYLYRLRGPITGSTDRRGYNLLNHKLDQIVRQQASNRHNEENQAPLTRLSRPLHQRLNDQVAIRSSMAPNMVRAFERLDGWRDSRQRLPLSLQNHNEMVEPDRLRTVDLMQHGQRATSLHGVFANPKTLQHSLSALVGANNDPVGAKISSLGFIDIAPTSGGTPMSNQVLSQETATTTTNRPRLEFAIHSNGGTPNLNGSLADRLSANRYKNRPRGQSESASSTTPASHQQQQQQQEPLTINLTRLKQQAQHNSQRTVSPPDSMGQAAKSQPTSATTTTTPQMEAAMSTLSMLATRAPLLAQVSKRQPLTGSTTATTVASSTTAATISPNAALSAALYAAAMRASGLASNSSNHQPVAATAAAAHHHHLHSHVHNIKPAIISIPMPIQTKFSGYESVLAAAAAAAAAAATAASSNNPGPRFGLKVGSVKNLKTTKVMPSPSVHDKPLAAMQATWSAVQPASVRSGQWQSPSRPRPITIPIGGSLASIAANPPLGPIPEPQQLKPLAWSPPKQQQQQQSQQYQGFKASLMSSAIGRALFKQPQVDSNHRKANSMVFMKPLDHQMLPSMYYSNPSTLVSGLNPTNEPMTYSQLVDKQRTEFESLNRLRQLEQQATLANTDSDQTKDSNSIYSGPFDMPLETVGLSQIPQALGDHTSSPADEFASYLNPYSTMDFSQQQPKLLAPINNGNYLAQASEWPLSSGLNRTTSDLINSGAYIDWSEVVASLNNNSSTMENMFDNVIFAPFGDNSNMLYPITLNGLVPNKRGRVMQPGLGASASSISTQDQSSSSLVSTFDSPMEEKTKGNATKQREFKQNQNKGHAPRKIMFKKNNKLQVGEEASKLQKNNLKGIPTRVVQQQQQTQQATSFNQLMPYALSHYIDEHNQFNDPTPLMYGYQLSDSDLTDDQYRDPFGSMSDAFTMPGSHQLATAAQGYFAPAMPNEAGFRPILNPHQILIRPLVGNQSTSQDQATSSDKDSVFQSPAPPSDPRPHLNLISFDDGLSPGGGQHHHMAADSTGNPNKKPPSAVKRQRQHKRPISSYSTNTGSSPLQIYEPQDLDVNYDRPIEGLRVASHHLQQQQQQEQQKLATTAGQHQLGSGGGGPIRLVLPTAHLIVSPTTGRIIQHALLHATGSMLKPHPVASGDGLLHRHPHLTNLHHHQASHLFAHRYPSNADLATSESARLSALMAPGVSLLAGHFWPITLALLPIMIIVAIVSQLIMAAPLAMFALTAMTMSRFAGPSLFGPISNREETPTTTTTPSASSLWYQMLTPAIRNHGSQLDTNGSNSTRAIIKLASVPSSSFIASIWPSGNGNATSSGTGGLAAVQRRKAASAKRSR